MNKTLQDHFKKGKWWKCNININDIFSCYRDQLMKLLEENSIFEPYPKVIKEAIVESQDYLTRNYTRVVDEYKTKRSKYFIDASNIEEYA